MTNKTTDFPGLDTINAPRRTYVSFANLLQKDRSVFTMLKLSPLTLDNRGMQNSNQGGAFVSEENSQPILLY